MKIKLKLTNYQLSFLNEFIADYLPENNIQGLSKEFKSMYYLMLELASKLLKNAIDKKRNFITQKSFSIGLKYYEAFALHSFLFININNVVGVDQETIEKRRITREILGSLNQKLA